MMKYLFMLLFLIPVITNYWLLMHILMFSCFIFICFNYLYSHISPTSVLFGLDMISYSLISLSYFIVYLMLMASYKIYCNNEKMVEFGLVIVLMMLSLMLTVSSLNMFIFYLSFEMSLIPTLFLIFGWGYQNFCGLLFAFLYIIRSITFIFSYFLY